MDYRTAGGSSLGTALVVAELRPCWINYSATENIPPCEAGASFLFAIEACDVNWPSTHPRRSGAADAPRDRELQARIAELEAEVARLRPGARSHKSDMYFIKSDTALVCRPAERCPEREGVCGGWSAPASGRTARQNLARLFKAAKEQVTGPSSRPTTSTPHDQRGGSAGPS